jgi:hypothetical protein
MTMEIKRLQYEQRNPQVELGMTVLLSTLRSPPEKARAKGGRDIWALGGARLVVEGAVFIQRRSNRNKQLDHALQLYPSRARPF